MRISDWSSDVCSSDLQGDQASAVVSIHKRDTSRGTRYDVRLRNAEGKTYNRTWRTRKEAESYERAELTARDRGDWIDPRARLKTFSEVAGEWLKSNPDKRPAKIRIERTMIHRQVIPAHGAKRSYATPTTQKNTTA